MSIALDHGQTFPPAKFLDTVKIPASLDQAGSKRMAEIMEPETLHARLLQGTIEMIEEIARIPFMTVARPEHMRMLKLPDSRTRPEYLHCFFIQRDRADLPVLLLSNNDCASAEIYLGPLEVDDFSLPHTGGDGERDDL